MNASFSHLLSASIAFFSAISFAMADRFVEYVEFPSGAYVHTSVSPTNAETRVKFSAKNVSGAAIFGLNIANGHYYYSFGTAATTWSWGITNARPTPGGAFEDGIHDLVFRENGTGKILLDGIFLADAATASSSTAPGQTKPVLSIGRGLQFSSAKALPALFEGRIYSFVIRNHDGTILADLKPCIREYTAEPEEGDENPPETLEEVCFYDRITGTYHNNADSNTTLIAGPEISGRLEIEETPFSFSPTFSLNPNDNVRLNLAANDEIPLSVPATIPLNGGGTATSLGYKIYRYDPLTSSYTETATGSSNSFTYIHDGHPTKVVWQWDFSVPEDGTTLWVTPNGDNENDGSSVDNAFASVQAAIDAAPAGATIRAVPGVYPSLVNTTVTEADGHRRSVLLTKAVRVIGIAGSKRTIINCGKDASRGGAYIKVDGAYLSGFTFTNGANSTTKAKIVGLEMLAGTANDIAIHARHSWASRHLKLNGTVARPLASDITLLKCDYIKTNGENESLAEITSSTYGGEIDGLTIIGQESGATTVGDMIYLNGRAATATAVLKNALVANNNNGLYRNSTRGTIVNCLNYSRLVNSTIANNTLFTVNKGAVAVSGNSIVSNCVIRGNFNPVSSSDDISGSLTKVFTTLCNQLSPEVNGNLNGNPNFVDEANGDYRLAPGSICIDVETYPGDESLTSTTDLLGNPRKNGAYVDLGCYEYQQDGSLSSDFVMADNGAIPGEALSVTFTGEAQNATEDATFLWNFGDGTTSATWPEVSHTYAVPGQYTVTLTVTDGESTYTRTINEAVTALPAVCYVREGATGVYPFDTWEKATGDIATALSVGSPKVLVDDGTYILPFPFICLDRPVELVSVNGPEMTILDSPKSVKTSQHRHFSIVCDDVVVSGFTLKGGYTNYGLGSYPFACALDISAGMVTNCVIKENGTLSRAFLVKAWGTARITGCTFDGNGVGTSNETAFQGALHILGSALVDNCVIHSYRIDGKYDTGSNLQGPVMLSSADATLRNSLIHSCTNGVSSDLKYGGIVQVVKGTVENCTIVDNFCGGKGAVKFFSNAGILKNSIVYNNTALMATSTDDCNDLFMTSQGPVVLNSCFGSFDGCKGEVGASNTMVNPNFSTEEENKYHLTSLSTACLGKASTEEWMTDNVDIDGNPRIDAKNGAPDMGCFEFVYSTEPEPLDGSIAVIGGKGRAPISPTIQVSAIGGDDELDYVYNWDFGNGETLLNTSESSVTHAYTTPGQYTVSVEVICGMERKTFQDVVLAVGDTCYVSVNGSNEPPYDTWEKAATDVLDAVDLAPKTIIVDDGVYNITGEGIFITTDTTLKSRNGAAYTTLKGADWVDYVQAFQSKRLFWINNPEATIEGITFSHGYSANQGDQIFGRVDAGLLKGIVITNSQNSYRSELLRLTGENSRAVNCVFDVKNGGGNADYQYYSAIVLLDGAVVDRCVIQNANYTTQGGSNAGHKAAIHVLTGSVLRNSLIKNCTLTQVHKDGGDKRNGAVIVNNSSTVENCTITGNTIHRDAALTIISSESATPVIRGNIIWGNTSTSEIVKDVCDVAVLTASTDCYRTPRITYSCASELTTGEGNISCDPKFVGENNKKGLPPYSLRNTTKCFAAGELLEWMEDALDILGNPRVIGGRPEMGCYELTTGIPTLLFVR